MFNWYILFEEFGVFFKIDVFSCKLFVVKKNILYCGCDVWKYCRVIFVDGFIIVVKWLCVVDDCFVFFFVS